MWSWQQRSQPSYPAALATGLGSRRPRWSLASGRAPEAPPATLQAPVLHVHQPRESQGPTQLPGGGGLTPAPNRKVDKELAVISNSPQVAQAGQGSPPLRVTDESEGPPKAQVAPWTLGLRVLCVAPRWPRTGFPLPPISLKESGKIGTEIELKPDPSAKFD